MAPARDTFIICQNAEWLGLTRARSTRPVLSETEIRALPRLACPAPRKARTQGSDILLNDLRCIVFRVWVTGRGYLLMSLLVMQREKGAHTLSPGQGLARTLNPYVA